ncbi:MULTISPECIES: helix-turn-helix domain-containing protein [unclassified Paraeggerthella]|uniref:helix-turn-helix domain-containing protein n=1 Tax=Paraeggerthella TaxID=651554 RepID=UPI000DF7F4FF|nr:helix-turn-helix domain-containing protein [Paraeggerthella sp. Marseille-Q4926]MDY3981956.1 helix-turn-helix domain-containing protein [Paraeggerthella sp.]RDB57920.1 XRE family transcriptional regulator [Paraeggerthella hongkongensis]
MASIQYFKLFDMLECRGYKRTDLREEVGLSTVTIAKLSKGESVTTDTILRICERFDVQPGDIMEYVPDER